MFILHFILGAIYVIIPILFIYYYRNFYIRDKQEKNFFLTGFLVKLIGAISAVLIYTQYYKAGDTTYYFSAGGVLADYIREYPSMFFEVFLRDNLKDYNEPNFLKYKSIMIYYKDTSSFFITKISTLLHFLSFDSFFITSILCSYFSFFFTWKFYKFLIFTTTLDKKMLGYAVFLMPSIVFWGSGLFKDTFTLGGIYLILISSVYMFGYNKIKFSYFLYMIIGFILLVKIRSFFLIAIFPFTAIWIFSLKYNAIKSASIRFMLLPFFTMIIIGGTILIVQTLTINFKELSVENLTDKSKGFQSWHTTLKGSAYSLGEIDYSTIGILSKIGPAINVTLFRPYLTEANKPIIFLSAMQSFFFFIFTLYVLLKTKIIFFISHLFKNPAAISLFGFSLFYAFIVGFTSFNFGALDRYKIPCLSTYILSIMIILDSYNKTYKRKE